jgi:Na+:H+ antiporter, NhaC family
VTVAEALLPLLVLVSGLAAAAVFLGLSGELLLLVILLAAAVAAVVALRHGASWDDIVRNTGEKVAAVLPAILILLAIGMLIGSWVASGTIPFLVHWGVRLVRPELLLLTAFLSTCVMSLFTGTSWGSAGTIGVALVGVATALGAPLGATAGAVVSGAYFGDKLSPLSDSTNVSALAAGTPLYVHIRHMLWTSVPSFTVAVLVFGVFARVGSPSGASLPSDAERLLAELGGAFRLSAVVVLPVLVVIWGIVRRWPPAVAIVASSAVAVILAVLVQRFPVESALAAPVGGFRANMIAGVGVDGAGWSPAFSTLVERGGVYSMAPTLVVILAAFLLAASMDVSGALGLLVGRLLGAVRSVFGLIAATMTTGATMIALTSHGGVTALVTGSLFQQAYRDRSLAPENLSRSIEDSVTITEPLMPWTVSAVFMAATLGVPTVEYAPWAVFCYGGPIFSLLIAATYRLTGIGMRPLPTERG